MPPTHSAAAKEIGRRIRTARQALGISLEDLGELADVNWTTIGKIERGVQSPTVETLVRIATALEVDAGSLITGITSGAYGQREHTFTARDFINARLQHKRQHKN